MTMDEYVRLVSKLDDIQNQLNIIESRQQDIVSFMVEARPLLDLAKQMTSGSKMSRVRAMMANG